MRAASTQSHPRQWMSPTPGAARGAHTHTNGTTFYAGWGTLALIDAGLAQGEGRSDVPWFVGSLLPGPRTTLPIAVPPGQPRDD